MYELISLNIYHENMLCVVFGQNPYSNNLDSVCGNRWIMQNNAKIIDVMILYIFESTGICQMNVASKKKLNMAVCVFSIPQEHLHFFVFCQSNAWYPIKNSQYKFVDFIGMRVDECFSFSKRN